MLNSCPLLLYFWKFKVESLASFEKFWRRISGQKLSNFENGNWAMEFWKAKLITCVGSEKASGVKKVWYRAERDFFLNFKEANLKKLMWKIEKTDANWTGKLKKKVLPANICVSPPKITAATSNCWFILDWNYFFHNFVRGNGK